MTGSVLLGKKEMTTQGQRYHTKSTHIIVTHNTQFNCDDVWVTDMETIYVGRKGSTVYNDNKTITQLRGRATLQNTIFSLLGKSNRELNIYPYWSHKSRCCDCVRDRSGGCDGCNGNSSSGGGCSGNVEFVQEAR